MGASETREETAVEPERKSELSETRRLTVEEKLTIQPKPNRGKWGRRFIIATGVLAILYLAWVYILPLLSLWVHF